MIDQKSKSSVGKLIQVSQEKEKQQEKLEKERKLIKNLISEIADSSVGRKWLRAIYELSEFGSVATDINPNVLQRREALRYFYVKAFRDFYTPKTLKNIESVELDQDEEE